MKVAVIGGGISGLCTAFRLRDAGVEVKLFESGPRVGGNINTVTENGYLVENGPNSLLANREILDLVNDLKLTGEIARPRPAAKKRFIVRNGRMVALPSGPVDIFTTDAFTAGGRLRLLKELFVKSKSPNGESVSDFFERRLGKEIAEYAVDPFISGIYAGDPHKLSIKSAFPRLYNYEKEAGSIIKGALFSPKDKNGKLPKDTPRSFTFKNGMSTLVDALQQQLGESVTTGNAVISISIDGDHGYRVVSESGSVSFDAVVVSTPANAASRLVADMDGNLAAELANIYYPPIAVVYAAFKRAQVKENVDGFGILVPAAEKRRILGCLFSSSLFDGRAPEGQHLFTIFIGGSRNAELCQKMEDELIKIGLDEVRSLLGITGQPTYAAIKKWDRSIPQYNIGYEKVPAAIDRFREQNPGIFFCSNFYKGISVGDCVKNSILTRDAVLEFLGSH
jgi:oxygen-dependent protoporphyrinogen oxidase